MSLIKKISAVIIRDFKLSIRNINDLLTFILFFFLSIFIFIFGIGSDREILNEIGVGILWVLLLFTFTLSQKKFYEEDFNSGSIVIIHMSGLSYEIIALTRILTNFIYIQLPFLISIPIAGILINLSLEKTFLFILSFLLGSIILSCLGSISASMNLLNKTNFSLGSVIIILFSIPVIIFSVDLINNENNFHSILYILIGIMLIFFAIAPWVSAYCIKVALENK